MSEDTTKENKENTATELKMAKKEEPTDLLRQSILKVQEGTHVHDPYLTELLIKTLASLLGLKQAYVKENIVKTEDVQGLSTNQAAQADIKRGNIVSFQFEEISFVAFYAHGTYTFFLGRSMKLIEIRSIYDLARCLDTEEGS